MPANFYRVALVSTAMALSFSISNSVGAQNNQVNTTVNVTNTAGKKVNAGAINPGAVNVGAVNAGVNVNQNAGASGNQGVGGPNVNTNVNPGNNVNANVNTNIGAGAAGNLNGPGSQSILNPGNLRGVGLSDIQNVLNTANDALQQAGITDRGKIVETVAGSAFVNGGKTFLLGHDPATGQVTTTEINPSTLSATDRVNLGIGSASDNSKVGSGSSGSTGSSGSGSGSGSGGSSGNGSRPGGQGTSGSTSSSGGSGGATSSSGSSSGSGSGGSGGKKDDKIIDAPVLQNVDRAIDATNGIGVGGQTGVQTDLNVNVQNGVRGVNQGLQENLGNQLNNVNLGGAGNVSVRSLQGEGAGKVNGVRGGAFSAGSPFANGNFQSGVSTRSNTLPGQTGQLGGVQFQGVRPGISLPGAGNILPGSGRLPGQVTGIPLGGIKVPNAALGGVKIPGAGAFGGSRIPSLPGLTSGVKIPAVTGGFGGVKIPGAVGGIVGKPNVPAINSGRPAGGGGRAPSIVGGGGTGSVTTGGGNRVPTFQKGGR